MERERPRSSAAGGAAASAGRAALPSRGHRAGTSQREKLCERLHSIKLWHGPWVSMLVGCSFILWFLCHSQSSWEAHSLWEVHSRNWGCCGCCTHKNCSAFCFHPCFSGVKDPQCSSLTPSGYSGEQIPCGCWCFCLLEHSGGLEEEFAGILTLQLCKLGL